MPTHVTRLSSRIPSTTAYGTNLLKVAIRVLIVICPSICRPTYRRGLSTYQLSPSHTACCANPLKEAIHALIVICTSCTTYRSGLSTSQFLFGPSLLVAAIHRRCLPTKQLHANPICHRTIYDISTSAKRGATVSSVNSPRSMTTALQQETIQPQLSSFRNL